MAARMIPVPGTTDTIVLLDYYHDAPNRHAVFRNLSRVAEDCSEVWLAEPPQPSYGDTWVSAELDGDEIEAHSWSGYVVRLDLATGTERSTTFHK